jgi:predicted RNase H-like nuclease (RuvC/YqgF family)
MTLTKASAGECHDVDLASRVESLESEVARLEEERRRLEREVVVRSERHAGADSHAATLERELSEANERNQRLESELVELRRERDRASEDAAADLALAPDAEDASSVSRVPNDSFAGRRVLLFTGHAVASTREAMRESFFEVGAMQVDCYWTDKARGPETFPEEAIVVIDVTFMSHSDSASIQARAARVGAWCLVCRRGASLIGREAAARFLARRVIARSGSSGS